MEPIKRKRAFNLFICFILCTSFSICANTQRPVKAEKIRNTVSQNLITEAEKHLNVREATGENNGSWVKKYLKVTGLSEGYPWCAAFQAYIHNRAEIPAPHSARVVDWFVYNVVWKREFGIQTIETRPGMVGAIYYQKLGRLGHIFLIVGQDANNYYTIEGNTNGAGSREGDGVYRKIRSKKSVAALADYCVNGRDFIEMYENELKRIK